MPWPAPTRAQTRPAPRLGGGGVQGSLQCLANPDLPVVATFEVPWRPPLISDCQRQGTVLDDGCGGYRRGATSPSRLKGGKVDKRFEERALLSPGLSRPVELAPPIVPSPNHCLDGPRLHVERHQRTLNGIS